MTASDPGPRRVPRRLWRALGVAALLPPFAAAFYSLSEPWAKARVIVLWGISRSIGATLLVAAGLAVAFAACAWLAWTGRRLRLAAVVHLATGTLLGFISWQAFAMVRDAGIRGLGILPIATVHPGRGLQVFFAAALWLVALGLVEVALSFEFPRPRRLRRAGHRAAD